MKDIPLNSWTERRSFSKFEAELDYMLNCDKEGNIDVSFRGLARRWGWGYVKVFRFIKELKKDKSETDFVTKVKQLKDLFSDSYVVLCNKSVTVNVTPKKMKIIKESSTIYKNKFDEIYQQKFKAPFYWKPKEVIGIKGIVSQLQFNMKSKNIEINSESTMNSFTIFINNIKDKWILEHFSPSIINSKFNEIVSSIKMSKKGSNMILHDDDIDKFNNTKTW